MSKQFKMLLALSCVFGSSLLAQGLNTQASKDDWEEINFEFSSAVLSDGYPSLLRLADLLQKNAAYHVKVEGNTDNIGSERSNEKLGLARANTVKDFLVKYGAKPDQIDVSTRGKRDPKYPGYKNGYSKTDVPRWMNRRVVLTVTDANGKTISDGGVGGAIKAIDTPAAAASPACCDDILKRLDQITALLNDMKGQNANLQKELDTLKNQQAGLENKINNAPKPLTEQQTAQVVDARLDKARDPRFSLLGVNIGADDNKNVTFTGSGRFFAPFKEHFAIQAQAEYLYYKTQKEGQFDIGMVDRYGPFQGGLFGSFKTVSMSGTGNGTIGQGSLVLDYIFARGKVGLFGTKAFLNNALLDRKNYTFQDASGNTITAPNVFMERYLHVVDQVGVQGTVALNGNNYLEANVGYLKSIAHADRPGGTVRFVFPLNTHIALTVEGGVNETMLSAGNSGRAVVGVQFGNLMRPKEFASVDHPVPMQIPRVRYEVATRRIQNGVAPPIADAGPDQLGIPASTVTLNGSGSHDPNGEALTFQWIQEGGPTVAIANANQAIATFTAVAGQNYTFRLTVRNTDNQTASARTRVTTNAAQQVAILFFNANPTSINAGQTSTLSWAVQNATTVTISPGIGSVNPTNGSVTVSPTATTTYTLTATNAQGSQNATATVVVNQPQPQLTVCTAVPMTINQGESATLYFQSLNATGVTISPAVGAVGNNGSVVVTPTASTTYTVTANNTFGSATCSVAVQVTPGTGPRIVKFSAAPLNIAQGSTSTLLWAVDNADTVTIDQGVGQVDNRAGTKDVTPQQTTLYTLTATNKFGTVTAQATINVTVTPPPPPAPTISSFTANPTTSPSPGAPVVLSCLAQNASRVIISGVGPVDKNGNITVNPTVQTTYVCVAVGNNPAQQASANLTVPIGTPIVPPGNGPTVVVTSTTAQCAAAVGTTTVCQTVYRLVTLDLSGTISANTPVTFTTSSRQTSAVVLNPSGNMVQVQLSELFGDYFFDVVATDSKGQTTTATVDLQYVRTSVR
jgi:hypothetical protein